MKVTELRIGNFISINFGNCDDGKIVTVDGVSDCEIYNEEHGYSPCNEFKPIPLTEQWLLDFGFEETIEGSFIKEFDGSTLIIFIINGVAQPIYKHYSSYSENEIDVVNAVCLLPVEYVHQLQNLFFALTQEELILKERSEEL